MYPEDTIRAEFWFFVQKRAADQRTGVEEPQASGTLLGVEERAYVLDCYLTDKHDGEMWDIRQPKTYATVQEALLAFLINEVATDDFPYGYPTWLRAVALILADAQRDPDLLLVVAYARELGEDEREREHRMTVSATDWDCLSRDTFRHVKHTYAGEERRIAAANAAIDST